MYERFTDRARKVMQLANQEALRLCHESIGQDHLLLGLVKQGPGVAMTALTNIGVEFSLRAIREVLEAMPRGPETVTMGKLPLTEAAKQTVSEAIAFAERLGHNYIGTEHLLLALSKDPNGLTAKLMAPKTADDLLAAVKEIGKEADAKSVALPEAAVICLEIAAQFQRLAVALGVDVPVSVWTTKVPVPRQ